MITAIVTALYVSAFTVFDWDPQEIVISCYLPTGHRTADGTVPYEGICASNRDHLGQTAMLFDSDMRFVGFFEVKDTGGHHLLREGKAVDIYRDNMDRARDFIRENGDHGYVVWLDAEG